MSRAEEIDQAQRETEWQTVLKSEAGRAFVWRLMERCHLNASSYQADAGLPMDPLRMAFLEGERNPGIFLLGHITTHYPELYLQMQREAFDRKATLERNHGNDD